MSHAPQILEPDKIGDWIPDNATIALTGSGIFLEADELFRAIESRFLATGHPRGLTIVHALGIGDGKASGLNRFAHAGMVRRVIGGHWSWSPRMQALARENKIEAYSLPAGVISTLLRESGAGRPGVITKIGLGTFADPRQQGGRCNHAAKEPLTELVHFDNQTYLRYKPLHIDIALVRGSDVVAGGNISFQREPTDLDAYAVALAAHNCGGKVLAQVERQGAGRIVPSRLARLPGILVDAVLVAPGARKTYLEGYDPHICGAVAEDLNAAPPALTLPKGIRQIIAQRAANEITGARSVNFGYGIPGGIPALLKEQGKNGYWGTVEQGIHNGELLDGPMFGAARDPDAIIPSIDQFDFYSGGGIDIAFLGMGEIDADGNVNVSMIGDTLVGPGGFIDITQTAKKVVFCGTFEAKGLQVDAAADGRLCIQRYGQVKKLVSEVSHITFSGQQARQQNQEVIYVTERAVFHLGPTGLVLSEISPGIDLQKDILQRMDFTPEIQLQQ